MGILYFTAALGRKILLASMLLSLKLAEKRSVKSQTVFSIVSSEHLMIFIHMQYSFPNSITHTASKIFRCMLRYCDEAEH